MPVSVRLRVWFCEGSPPQDQFWSTHILPLHRYTACCDAFPSPFLSLFQVLPQALITPGTYWVALAPSRSSHSSGELLSQSWGKGNVQWGRGGGEASHSSHSPPIPSPIGWNLCRGTCYSQERDINNLLIINGSFTKPITFLIFIQTLPVFCAQSFVKVSKPMQLQIL